MTAELVEQLIDSLCVVGERVLAQPVAVTSPDPDDQPFLEVAVAGHADALITGNTRHFPRCEVPAVSPADFPAGQAITWPLLGFRTGTADLALG
jgi:hypothetical protein